MSGHDLNTDELPWLREGLKSIELYRNDDTKDIYAQPYAPHPHFTGAILGAWMFTHFGDRNDPHALMWMHQNFSSQSPLFDDALSGSLNPLTAFRLHAAIAGVGTVVIIFLLLAVHYDLIAAFFAALLLAVDPFHIAISRLGNGDALLMFFLVATFASYLHGEFISSVRWKIIASVCFGLALLTKMIVASVFAVGIIFLWKLGCHFLSIPTHKRIEYAPNREKKKHNQKETVWWKKPVLFNITSIDFGVFIGGYIFMALVFPPLWGNPIEGYSKFTQSSLSAATGISKDFFFGKAWAQTPPYYLLMVLPTRMTEVLILAMCIGLTSILKKMISSRNETSIELFTLILFLIIFGVFSFQTNHRDRYAITLWFSFVVWGGIGIRVTIDWLMKKANGKISQRTLLGVIAATLLSIGVWVSLRYAPRYYLYYNDTFGGPAKAASLVEVGWGEGVHDCVRYIREQYGNTHPIAVLYWQVAQYYYGANFRLCGWKSFDNNNWKFFDFIILQKNYVQREPQSAVVQFCKQKQPLFTARYNNVDFAWVYSVK